MQETAVGGGGGGLEEVGSLWMSSDVSNWHDDDVEAGPDPVFRSKASTMAVVEPSVGGGRRRTAAVTTEEGESKRDDVSPSPSCAPTAPLKQESWMEWLGRPSKSRAGGMLGCCRRHTD